MNDCWVLLALPNCEPIFTCLKSNAFVKLVDVLKRFLCPKTEALFIFQQCNRGNFDLRGKPEADMGRGGREEGGMGTKKGSPPLALLPRKIPLSAFFLLHSDNRNIAPGKKRMEGEKPVSLHTSTEGGEAEAKWKEEEILDCC